MAGGVLGLAVAFVGLEVFTTMNPNALWGSSLIGVDLRVAAFAAFVSVGTAVLFGLLPLLRTMGTDLTNELKGSSRATTGGKGTQRFRSGLVVVEVAVSLVLVAQAGLLLKSFAQVQAHDPGFDPEGVWTVPLSPTGMETPADYLSAMNGVLASLQSLPGVEAASYGLTQPFEFNGSSRCCWSNGGVEIDGEVRQGLRIALQPVSSGYFETLRLPLVAGSVWTSTSEGEQPIPAVVSERLAIDVFGSADEAMGKVLGASGPRQLRVVGVAADNKHYGLDQEDPTSAYVPISVLPFVIPMAHMAVRIRGEAPAGLARTLREAIWREAPDMPIPTVRSMDDWIAGSMSGRRFDSAVVGAFGFAGLLLAAAGLYGTLLYNVRQQRRELAIRLALGAERSRVERSVVARGIQLALAGSLMGLVASWWVGGLLESRLYNVEASDPLALGGAAAVLLLVSVIASWLPARRAGRTDPIQILQAE